MDSAGAGGIFAEAVPITIASQSVSYATAINNDGAVFDGATNYIDLGYKMGTCLTHLEFCQTLQVDFLLYFNGVKNGDQYIFSRTTSTALISGYYMRYANLDPLLPLRRYFEVGVKHEDKYWKGVVNIEAEVWMKVILKWSLTQGLELLIDGMVAVSDSSPTTEAGVSERTDTTSLMFGKSNIANLNYAAMKVDEINQYDGVVGPDTQVSEGI